MIPSEQKFEQLWHIYRPFIYKFYLQHTINNFQDIISAKWDKEQSIPTNQKESSNTLNFVIVGLQKLNTGTSQYQYIFNNYQIVGYQMMIPEDKNQNSIGQQQHSTIKQINQINYQKQITCFEDIFIDQKKAIDNQTSRSFYAVAIKNQSIRFINANKLFKKNSTKNMTFLNSRSPFLKKNAKFENLIIGNQMEAGIINLERQITVMKYNNRRHVLLCGCKTGEIILIHLSNELNDPTDKIMTTFEYNKQSISDLVWLNYPSDQTYSFVSVAEDKYLLIWNQDICTHPIAVIPHNSIHPLSIIQVYPDRVILAGKDNYLCFFEISKNVSFTYSESTSIITKIFNLSKKIQYQKSKKQICFDPSIRFVTCQQNGKIVFWQGQKQFEHITHKERIGGFDFINTKMGGIYLAIEKQKGKMSIFSPILGTFCLQDISQ